MTPSESQDQTQEERATWLSDAQRRSLSALLRRVERAAWQLEEQMQQEVPADLALTSFLQQPTMLQLGALLRLASLLRSKVAQLALEWAMEPEEESCLRRVQSTFTRLGSELEVVRPEVLQCSGAMPAQREEQLGRGIDEVMALILALSEVAGESRDALSVLRALDLSDDEYRHEICFDGYTQGPSQEGRREHL
jgi:hypothetical protein